MSETTTALATQTAATNAPSIFSDKSLFEEAQRFASALCKSTIVPQAYQNNLPNTLVALEMATRMGESPLMVMQNLDIIHGKPSFSSKFVIARINTCGRFAPLRFEYSGDGESRQCVAHSKDAKTGEVLRGAPCSIAMAKKEGWFGKNGSKWPTMPDLMLMYRAAAFFGRMYAPELLMGMQTSDELIDISSGAIETTYTDVTASNRSAQDLNAKLQKPAVDKPQRSARKSITADLVEQPSVETSNEAAPVNEDEYL